jgi:DNA-binding CsgD family transcriptional regulator
VAAYVGADVSGDLRDVPRLLADARDIDPAFDGTLDASVAASYLLLHGDGDIATAHRLLVGTIEAHLDDAGPASKALVEALQTLFEVCIYGVRPELWPPLDAALARLGPRIPPTLGLITRTLADPIRATADDLAVLDVAIAGLADETDPARIERVATVALMLDRATECSEALWRLVRNGRDGGGVASAIMALTVICMDHYGTGRWAEGEHLNAEGLRLCDLHGYELLRAPLLLVQALIAAARGEEETVRRLAAETSAWATPRGVQAFQFFGSHARGLLALGRGDFESAYRQLSLISPAGTLPPHVAHAVWVILDLVESAVRSGHRAEAAAHVSALHDDDVAALSPRLALVTAASEALVEDDDDAAAASFERALAIPGVDRWPFDLARARLVYGERLRRSRATSAAREHLTAALEAFGTLGAEPWRARAAGELAATGSTRPRGEVTGPAALTPQQRKVADLAAAGSTNKEIAGRLSLSPRTVGAHLRQIFRKLDVRSRGGLRDALDR